MKLFKKIQKNILSPYQLIFLNKKTLAEDFSLTIKIWKLLFLIMFLLALSLIAGYYIHKKFMNLPLSISKNIDEDQMLVLQKEINRLNKQIENNEDYLSDVQKILNGETPTSNTPIKTEPVDTYSYIKEKHDSAAAPSAISKEKVKIQAKHFTDEKTIRFYFTPLRGIISHGFSTQKNHTAVDIVAQQGEPIKSIADGVVLFADWTSSTGYVVLIQHPQNVISVYKHNSQVYKKIGDNVKMGEVIAAVGNTGELTTGPHLHFEIWVNGQAQNPEKYITF